jgi:hypothetical protein
MNNLEHLLSNSNWNSLIKTYSIYDVVDSHSFQELITIVYKMLYNDEWDDEIQNYATDLLYVIREKYQKEWDSSWTFDSFLGNACNITLRYDERYIAYKRASEKATPIPPSLLVLLAECYISPGISPVSQEEAESLLRKSLQQEKTIEGVSLLKMICKEKNDIKEVIYWEKILQELEKQNIHIHDIQPKFLKSI